jgi:hypothetical protein
MELFFDQETNVTQFKELLRETFPEYSQLTDSEICIGFDCSWNELMVTIKHRYNFSYNNPMWIKPVYTGISRDYFMTASTRIS